jgi:hypothetical protein
VAPSIKTGVSKRGDRQAGACVGLDASLGGWCVYGIFAGRPQMSFPTGSPLHPPVTTRPPPSGGTISPELEP